MDSTTGVVTLHQPRCLVFGAGSAQRIIDEVASASLRSVLFVTSPPLRHVCDRLAVDLEQRRIRVSIWDQVIHEPDIDTFHAALAVAKSVHADGIIGLGGGSAMDVAKLVAALLDGCQDIYEVFGIGKLEERRVYLACLPTTAGTGSEASPNAILLDRRESLKKGVISPYLVPDAAYVDPLLTLSVPADLTAATGMDALTHCIEAYVNRYAHPMIDLYAREGIRLIARSLRRAVTDGQDLMARSDLALASLFGGICLGPVNTGAVHALSYPLGSSFGIAHGVANAVLLPHVLRFNLSAAPERYAEVARAMGLEGGDDLAVTAQAGVELVEQLARDCGIPQRLTELGIAENAIESMAQAAMKITRLLERNVREVTYEDAVAIYREAM